MQDRDPKVSVVIPTYNRSGFVEQAIDSVLAQSLRPLEVIVVDDGSTDDTLAKLDRMYSGVQVRVIAGDHRGVSSARNQGVRAARAEFVAFLDSDDLFEPEKLSVSCQMLACDPRLSFVHGYWLQHNLHTGEQQAVKTRISGDARHELLMFGRIATPTVVVRREDFLSIGGFRESLEVAEDYDLWCRLSSIGPVGLIRTPLSVVRLHGHNTPRKAAAVLRNQLKVVRHYFAFYPTEGLKVRKFYIANSLYPVASLCVREKNVRMALRIFFVAWKYDLKSNPARAALAIVRAIRVMVRSLIEVAGRPWHSQGVAK